MSQLLCGAIYGGRSLLRGEGQTVEARTRRYTVSPLSVEARFPSLYSFALTVEARSCRLYSFAPNCRGSHRYIQFSSHPTL